MRDIKFRCWTEYPDGAEMEYFDLWDNGTFLEEEKGSLPIMQYTGLKDKNGKEIYEGDILKPMFNENVYVEYETISASFIIVEKVSGFGYSLDGEEQYEVIGNIYENPELI